VKEREGEKSFLFLKRGRETVREGEFKKSMEEGE
jgi:hypothetical protein